MKTAYGKQQGVSVGYNPHKRGAASYHPLLAFCAETKEILQGWLRDGSAYTSNGVVEFSLDLFGMGHLGKRCVCPRDDQNAWGEMQEKPQYGGTPRRGI